MIGDQGLSGYHRITALWVVLGLADFGEGSGHCDIIWWCIFVHQYLVGYVFTVGQYICGPVNLGDENPVYQNFRVYLSNVS